VRLDEQRMERLERHCKDTGCTPSDIIRLALDAYLHPGPDSTDGNTRPRLAPPEAAFRFVPRFTGWGSGDVREYRNRLYLELLGCSFACKQLFPRTTNMVDGYIELRQLAGLFGVEE
jgi:hypothetical protein